MKGLVIIFMALFVLGSCGSETGDTVKEDSKIVSLTLLKIKNCCILFTNSSSKYEVNSVSHPETKFERTPEFIIARLVKQSLRLPLISS